VCVRIGKHFNRIKCYDPHSKGERRAYFDTFLTGEKSLFLGLFPSASKQIDLPRVILMIAPIAFGFTIWRQVYYEGIYSLFFYPGSTPLADVKKLGLTVAHPEVRCSRVWHAVEDSMPRHRTRASLRRQGGCQTLD